MAKKKSTGGGGALRDQPQTPTPLRFHRVVVYSLYGEPFLSLTNTCSDLIDKLISICVAGPEFLPPETSRRYLHLLPNFKNFVFSVAYPARREILVANEPITAIKRSMEEWIWSFVSDQSHPILPSYALDLTEFMARMIPGQQPRAWDEDGRPGFEVKGLVKTEPDYSASLSNDKRFKSEFTRKNPLYRVICRVPPNGAVKYQNEVIFRPGEEFTGLQQQGIVKVSVADVRVEHQVKLTDFTQWLERKGRSPREVIQRQKLRSILGMPAQSSM